MWVEVQGVELIVGVQLLLEILVDRVVDMVVVGVELQLPELLAKEMQVVLL